MAPEHLEPRKPFKDYKENGGLALRTYRAINWTHRARTVPDDSFGAFLFFCVAFNSLYDSGDGSRSRAARRSFFEQLWDADGEAKILEALGVVALGIRGVLEDERAYESDDRGKSLKWREPSASTFERKRFARDVPDALEIAFDPLSRVRNWLVHGGISWGSRIMEPILSNGTAILTRLVPTFIEIMLAEPNRPVWSFPTHTPDRYEDRTRPKDLPAPGPGRGARALRRS